MKWSSNSGVAILGWHIGLSTVTYLFAGDVMHRDSLGYEQAIRPQEVNWMTAGRGITHSGLATERTGQKIHRQRLLADLGVQFLALGRLGLAAGLLGAEDAGGAANVFSPRMASSATLALNAAEQFSPYESARSGNANSCLSFGSWNAPEMKSTKTRVFPGSNFWLGK